MRYRVVVTLNPTLDHYFLDRKIKILLCFNASKDINHIYNDNLTVLKTTEVVIGCYEQEK